MLCHPATAINTEKRKPPVFFSAAQRVYITVCIPYWTINTLHQTRSQAVTEIWDVYPRRGSKSQENLRSCHQGTREKPLTHSRSQLEG